MGSLRALALTTLMFYFSEKLVTFVMFTSSVRFISDLLDFFCQILVHDRVRLGIDEDDHAVDLVILGGDCFVSETVFIESSSR